jgi:hypothetical protein
MDPAPGVATAGSTPAAAAYESQVATDLARRAAIAAPVVVVALGLARGVDGALSATVGLALVALNFLLAARLVGWAAGKSIAAVYGTVMGGYVVRLGALLGIVIGLERVSWIDVPVLVITIAVAHLALLVWEMRYVSLSLAAPGLKPTAADRRTASPGGRRPPDRLIKE